MNKKASDYVMPKVADMILILLAIAVVVGAVVAILWFKSIYAAKNSQGEAVSMLDEGNALMSCITGCHDGQLGCSSDGKSYKEYDATSKKWIYAKCPKDTECVDGECV